MKNPQFAPPGATGATGPQGPQGPQGPAGGGGVFSLFASNSSDIADTAAGATNGMTVSFNSPSGGLALITITASIQATANGSGMTPSVKVDGAGAELVPSKAGGLPFLAGSASGNGVQAEASSMSFTATLPSGAHTLNFNLTGIFGANYSLIHGTILVQYS